MRLIWVWSSFSGDKLTADSWLSCQKLAEDMGVEIQGIIVTPTAYEIDGMTSYVFNPKDNENFALSYLLKNCDMTSFDGMIFVDAFYQKKLEVFEQFILGLEEGKNIMHVKKNYSKVFEIISESFISIKNRINKMLLGTKESSFVGNFVAFDKVVLELLCDFPHRCGFIRETNYLTNTDVGVVDVDSKFKKAKSKKTNILSYIFVALEMAVAITAFMLVVWLPLYMSEILWLIIVMIVAGVGSVLHLSIANIDSVVNISKKKAEPIILGNAQKAINEEVEPQVVPNENDQTSSEDQTTENEVVVIDDKEAVADTNEVKSNKKGTKETASKTSPSKKQTSKVTSKKPTTSKKSTTTKKTTNSKKSTASTNSKANSKAKTQSKTTTKSKTKSTKKEDN